MSNDENKAGGDDTPRPPMSYSSSRNRKAEVMVRALQRTPPALITTGVSMNDSVTHTETQTFSRWFGKTRYVPVVAATKNCRLTYTERLVSSWLVFRTEREEETTQAQIAKRLRLREKRSVKTALKHLEDLGLARCRDRWHWSALEPPQELRNWFAYNGREGSWLRRFATYKVCRAAVPDVLNLNEEGLWFLLISLCGKGTFLSYQTKSGLASLLNVSLNTIKNSLRGLQTKNLVVPVDKGFKINEPPAEVLGWFVDGATAPPKTPKAPSKPANAPKPEGPGGGGSAGRVPTQFRIKETEPPEVQEAKSDLNTALRRADIELGRAGVSEESARDYWVWAVNTIGDWQQMAHFATVHFSTVLQMAMEEHDPARAPNCLGLLRKKCERFFQDQYL